MTENGSMWLVRHGETAWSRTGQHTGRTDLPLTPKGEDQARALGRFLNGRSFARVLCSPLQRARETCRIAGYGDNAETWDDLLEWDYGDLNGITLADFRQRVPGFSLWKDGAPNGESLEQVAARADRVIAAAAGGGDVALFAHGHILRIVAARWIGLSPEGARLLAFGTGAVSVLDHENEDRVIRRWNLPAGA